MVLSDVTKEYQNFISIIEKYNVENSFIQSALYIIETYQDQINTISSVFIHSAKGTNDVNALSNNMKAVPTKYAKQIAYMNSGIRNTTLLISELHAQDFQSAGVQNYVNRICESLNSLLDITEAYSSAKINNQDTSSAFFSLIDEAANFMEIYSTVIANGGFLSIVEEELLDSLPDYIDENEPIYSLDVRSFKASSNLSTFVNDLQLLVESLSRLESILLPGESSTIFLRKIESGSLKAKLDSTKIDISLFPDIISSLSQAIRTFRLAPVEKEQIKAETQKLLAEANKINAEAQMAEAEANKTNTEACKAKAEASKINAEAQIAEAEANKTNAEARKAKAEAGKINAEAIKAQMDARVTELQIINSQIAFLTEHLGLDPEKPEDREKIQHLCLPILRFLENNPKGQFNDYKYDITRDIGMLEEQSR